MIGEKRFEIVMSLHHGNSIDSLTSNEFVPHTAVAVVTSLECVDWLEDVVRRLWLPEGRAEKSCNLPSYRGMPLIMLALDKGNSYVTTTISYRYRFRLSKIEM